MSDASEPPAKKARVHKKIDEMRVPRWMVQGRHAIEPKHTRVAKLQQILHPHVLRVLSELGIERLFPVQSTLIPYLIASGSPHGPGGDVCVCAPTGSGKTLAFVVPIVQHLLDRVVCRLRAVAIVPTRDLALQVVAVFESFCRGTCLKVGIATGQSSFASEQSRFVDEFGACRIDILVCTAGRLVDHIRSTPQFSLRDLSFLVIDEADRMLTQSYHDWIFEVLAAGEPHASPQSQLAAPLVRKLLFSATMKRNPRSYVPLALVRPQFFDTTDTGSLYTTPTQLEARHVVCELAQKPLVVAHLLALLHQPQTILFTASVQSTHRLFLLLNPLGCARAAEFSALLSQQARTAILSQFREKKINLLVCSDAMARGMDVDAVDLVINYDAPVFIKTYIHRCGRTARAGRAGSTYTLLRAEEVRHFKRMLTKCDCESKEYRVPSSTLEPMAAPYEEALEKLRTVLQQEDHARRPADALTATAGNSASSGPDHDLSLCAVLRAQLLANVGAARQ